MKKKKEERQEKLETFRNHYLPEIEKMFYVESHGSHVAPSTMYKVIINHILNFDYYPMSGKIRKNENISDKWFYRWFEYDPENFLQALIKYDDYKKSIVAKNK